MFFCQGQAPDANYGSKNSLLFAITFLPGTGTRFCVSVEFKITSYTRFAADLKENYLHAIISGFSIGDTPGVGTFYDFHLPGTGTFFSG